MNQQHSNILLVANWKSDVGYAWWLMESFWAAIAYKYHTHQKVLLAYPKINTLPESIEKAPLNCQEIDFTLTDGKSILKQCQFLLANKISTIYFTDKPSIDLRYALFYLLGVKHIIVHDHTPGNRTKSRGVKKLVKTILHRTPYIRATAMIATSPFVSSRHVDVNCFPQARCFIANNGIPAATTTDTINVHEKFGIPKQQLVMVMTGRANRYKGIDFILKSLAELKEQLFDQVNFLFLGDGPDLEHFKSLSKELKIDELVSFPGRCNNIAAHLKGCDFAIHPSKGEVGYSLSILEYMQNRLPVIVPDNPSVCGATINGENGLIYKDGNIAEASAAITALATNAQMRKSMGAAAQQHQITQFNLEKTHKELIQAFSNVLSNT